MPIVGQVARLLEGYFGSFWNYGIIVLLPLKMEVCEDGILQM